MDTLLGKLTRGLRNSAPVPYAGRSGTLFDSTAQGSIGERAYDAYGSVGTLFAIVHQITDAFAPVEWHLYQKTSVRDKKRRKEIPNHPFLTVWDMPNKFMTGVQFREACQQHLDLVGETFFILVRAGSVIIEMWPVRPDRMTPVKDPDAYLLGWVYKGPGGEEVPLRTEDVIQIKYPNPSDPYRGMGPVQTVLSDLDASRYAAEWNRNFFVNGATPGGIIKVDRKLRDDEFNSLIRRWRAQHQGVANAHRVAVLENAEWVDTKFTMEDMQFAQLRELPRELIREAFAFPKAMLGTVDDVNRANADAGKEIMAENQTIPRLLRWKEVINTWLLPEFANGKNLEADFDDPTPINHDQLNNERSSQSTSARNLVMAGYHPEDVSEAMGLPEMRWVGIPAATPAQPSENGDQGQNGNDASSLFEVWEGGK